MASDSVCTATMSRKEKQRGTTMHRSCAGWARVDSRHPGDCEREVQTKESISFVACSKSDDQIESEVSFLRRRREEILPMIVNIDLCAVCLGFATGSTETKEPVD